MSENKHLVKPWQLVIATIGFLGGGVWTAEDRYNQSHLVIEHQKAQKEIIDLKQKIDFIAKHSHQSIKATLYEMQIEEDLLRKTLYPEGTTEHRFADARIKINQQKIKTLDIGEGE